MCSHDTGNNGSNTRSSNDLAAVSKVQRRKIAVPEVDEEEG